jgi:hypothetical protein
MAHLSRVKVVHWSEGDDMADEPSQPEKDIATDAGGWIQAFLEGLIATDEEEKKPENIDPSFRHMEDVGGIHFWQLQQCIEELGCMLADGDEDLDALEARWRDHELYWGRYLSTGAIEYARRRREDPEYDDGEFSMDWFANVEEDPQE